MRELRRAPRERHSGSSGLPAAVRHAAAAYPHLVPPATLKAQPDWAQLPGVVHWMAALCPPVVAGAVELATVARWQEARSMEAASVDRPRAVAAREPVRFFVESAVLARRSAELVALVAQAAARPPEEPAVRGAVAPLRGAAHAVVAPEAAWDAAAERQQAVEARVGAVAPQPGAAERGAAAEPLPEEAVRAEGEEGAQRRAVPAARVVALPSGEPWVCHRDRLRLRPAPSSPAQSARALEGLRIASP